VLGGGRSASAGGFAGRRRADAERDALDGGRRRPPADGGARAHGANDRRGQTDVAISHAKIAPATEADARKAVAAALRSGRALSAFEPFGRDVERSYFVATARGGFELQLSTEAQGCFGNAFLEVLQSPRTEGEKAGTTAAVKALVDKLTSEGVVSCFSLCPSDDVGLASAFLQNGFRRTGLLHEHLLVRSERKDAILWSRKLANPADE
jgi:hypothetical protein